MRQDKHWCVFCTIKPAILLSLGALDHFVGPVVPNNRFEPPHCGVQNPGGKEKHPGLLSMAARRSDPLSMSERELPPGALPNMVAQVFPPNTLPNMAAPVLPPHTLPLWRPFRSAPGVPQYTGQDGGRAGSS